MHSDGQSCAHERYGRNGQGAPHCVSQWSKGIATATATAAVTAAAAAAMENHLLSHVTRTHATDPTTQCPVTRPYETNGRAAPSSPGGPHDYISTASRRVAGGGRLRLRQQAGVSSLWLCVGESKASSRASRWGCAGHGIAWASMGIESAAAERKARIAALRALRQAEEAGDQAAIDANAFGRQVKQHFRTSRPPPAGMLASASAQAPMTLEQEVDGMQEQVIQEDTRKQAEELDLTNIAPRRANWDLRRDLDERLARLEPKTQAAIHTLIVQRIRASRDRDEEAANVLVNE